MIYREALIAIANCITQAGIAGPVAAPVQFSLHGGAGGNGTSPAKAIPDRAMPNRKAVSSFFMELLLWS